MKKILIILLTIPAISFSQCKDEDVYIKTDKYEYTNTRTWTDSGCASKKTYRMKKNKKWVEISECLFNWYENRICLCSDGNERLCCGHIHLTKPGK